MRVLQGNIQHCKVANDLLSQIVLEKKIDLLIISEQYRDRDGSNWYPDTGGTAAIWIPNTYVFVKSHGRANGLVWVTTSEANFVSCYFSPNENVAEFQDRLDRLEDLLRSLSGTLIVAGDFNARAIDWGMPRTDLRGRKILEMAARIGLAVANVGDSPTFRRPGYGPTIPDVTFTSENVSRRIADWRVIEDYTGSDHQYITFSLATNSSEPRNLNWTPGWNVSRLDAVALSSAIDEEKATVLESSGTTGDIVQATMRLIERSCDSAMPRKAQPRSNRRSAYWWTEDIAVQRRQCLKLRRKVTRSRRRGGMVPETLMQEFRAARQELKRAISASKASKWKALTEDLNNDPWGLGYRVVMRRLGVQSANPNMSSVQLEAIVDALFPAHRIRPNEDVAVVPEQVPLFSELELESAIGSMRCRKAPGPDGVPTEVLKVVGRVFPGLLLNMYNRCLLEGLFPLRWKVQRLVLISKGKGDPETPSAYRPLCMLDTAGKLFERLLKPRLTQAVEVAGGLSDRQYGFRAGRSTIGAVGEVIRTFEAAQQVNHRSRRLVMLATLDVRNAFNSARWADMLSALKTDFVIPPYLLRMLQSYLKDRKLVFSTPDGPRRRDITAGAAQGSILGPDLWNIAYDGILRMEMPRETFLVGYADDIAVIITARDVDELQRLLTLAMGQVIGWMDDHGLSLATEKTEIVLLTRRRINPIVQLAVDREVIATKPVVKYLGMRLDVRLTFRDQITFATEKAEKIVASLSRLMRNVGGPVGTKRRVLMSVVHSVLLFGCETWAEALKKKNLRGKMATVQRRGALRIASAYRTVSEPAVLVVAGVIPIDLLAFERKQIFDGDGALNRAEARERTMEDWRNRWESDERGRWTARLIGDLREWVEREHGEVDFYLTQLLTGHGCFGAYLHKMRKLASPECQYGDSDFDDVLHTFFHCVRWEADRRDLETAVGPISPDTLVHRMLSSPESWNAVSAFSRRVLKEKRSVQL